MRKFSLLTVLTVFVSLTIMAQDKPKNRTGFRIGATYYTQRIETDAHYKRGDYVTGLAVGIFREIAMNKNLTFQPELFYNRMGGEADGVTTKLNYISLPLLLKVHSKRFGAYVGPQLSLLISGHDKKEFDVEEDIKDKYKSADIGGIGGIEYNLGPNNRFVISARYQFSINDVLKDGGAGESIRNTGIQLTAGFRF